MPRRATFKIALMVAAAVALGSAALFRDAFPFGRIAEVDRAIRAEMEAQGIPGLSAAIVVDRRLRWSSGFGMAGVENGVPATSQTVYRLASISKPITAVAVLQLVERGQLDLDAPIQTYVPSFPEKSWNVTPRQLLAHLGGIRGYRGQESDNLQHYDSVSQALAIFQDDPLEHPPGTKYAYSTYGYSLLGAAIEGAARVPYVDYVRDHVFRPAGMDHIQVDDHFAIIPNRARGYYLTRAGGLKNSVMDDTSNKIPGGGFCSTVVDVAKFAIAFQTGVLLSSESVELMMTNQRTVEGKPVDYGLGWNLSKRRGRREVWHKGGQRRVSTILYMQPDRGFAVALMSNLEGAELMPLARKIADIMDSSPY